jgi:hypothetical protein
MPDELFSKISFYVVAHADDWQLFMQPNAYNDLIAPASKVVFIITTAGDAGLGETYWAAREEGCKSSVRFCLAPIKALLELCGTKEFYYHHIHYWSIDRVTCFFLRLPDGNLDGNGFSSNYNQSLSKFREREAVTITAIDKSTTYNDWLNFYTTLQTIIYSESLGIDEKLINYLNPDPHTNPNDHIDHIVTGQAIQQMATLSDLRQALFVGYSVSDVQENLQGADLFWKAGMFAAYEKAVFDRSGYSTLQESIPTYIKWCLSSPKFITC